MSTASSKLKRTKPEKPLVSVTVPLEEDSDPDFNPGVFDPESEAGQSSPKKSKKKKDGSSHQRKRRGPQASHAKQYASLFPYFGSQALGFDYSSDADEHGEPPAETSSSPKKAEDDRDEEESITQSETEDEATRPLKRPAPAPTAPERPLKKVKVKHKDDESSVTQSETDDELSIAKSAPLNGNPISSLPNDEESVTAPESDGDPLNDESLLFVEGSSRPEKPPSSSQSRTYRHRPDFAYYQRPKLPPHILNMDEGVKVPEPINSCLREYQRDGVRFFFERWENGKGGLLGDDMGLGKTIQVIAFLSAIMRKYGDTRDLHRRRKHVSQLQDSPLWKKERKLPPANATWPTCLIIAPTPVVPNWERELNTWSFFELGVYHDKKPAERQRILDDFKLGRLDIVLTSHELARMDISLMDDLPWSVIIVDEVHKVKNPKSHTTEAFHQFHLPSPSALSTSAPYAYPNSPLIRRQVRFGLTGTAVQNNYKELWTILDWTSPGQAGSLSEWKHLVADPLMVGQSASASEEERSLSRLVANALTYRFLPHFFLRRTKKIIQDQLPKKTDEVVFCPLTPKQIDIYKRVLAIPAVQLLARAHEPCDCDQQKSPEKRSKCCYPIETAEIFRYMTFLIKVSNHVALLLPSKDDTEEQTIRNRELCSQVFPPDPIPKSATAMFDSSLCGKWKVLETLLREWRKDPKNKVLVFTKSVKLLSMLEHYLQINHFGFVRLDGKVPTSERMALIDLFHDDPQTNIFLISTLTGGTGLNLTGANKVVIFDPNWNPAHDLQAMDRAYRFGQTRDVSVYRLLGAGSIEELIYARQVYKQQQMHIVYEASAQTRYFEGVQGDKTRQGELFGLKNIFSLQEEALVTKMAIERAHISELDWALKHMQAQKPGSKGLGKVGLAFESEVQRQKGEDDLQGLGALMFSDTLPIRTEEGIRKSLDDTGIKYSHFNENVLRPNALEAHRERQRGSRKRGRGSGRSKVSTQDKMNSRKTKPETEETKSWPPVRRHHRPPDPPEVKLGKRKDALVELGYLEHPEQYGEFAATFVTMAEEDRNDLFAKLDAHAKASRWGRD